MKRQLNGEITSGAMHLLTYIRDLFAQPARNARPYKRNVAQ